MTDTAQTTVLVVGRNAEQRNRCAHALDDIASGFAVKSIAPPDSGPLAHAENESFAAIVYCFESSQESQRDDIQALQAIQWVSNSPLIIWQPNDTRSQFPVGQQELDLCTIHCSDDSANLSELRLVLLESLVRGTNQDLTAARAANKRLSQENDHLRQLNETAYSFVDNASHEFRTPLTVIKEYLALVCDGVMGEVGAEQERFLRIAADRANDLNTLVDDMLDVSKLEAGNLHVARRPVDLAELIDSVSQALERKSMIREISLNIQVPNSLPIAYGDAEKITRVLINLVINAMKFTQPGGCVQLEAREDGRDIRLSVSDTGVGIATDDLKRIFERFQQVGGSARNNCKGFGLGLSIVKELVDLNFGALSVESELGSGSKFSFTVPKFDHVEITRRFLKNNEKSPIELLVAETPELSLSDDQKATDEIDNLLHYVIPSADLVFRPTPARWVILHASARTPGQNLIRDLSDEMRAMNRNRPRGPLPTIDINTVDRWPTTSKSVDEIIALVSLHLSKEIEVVSYA